MRRLKYASVHVGPFLALFSALTGVLYAADAPSTEPKTDPVLLKLSASGKNGSSGTDGVSYNSQAGMNSHGQNGGDATASTPGESAGEIQLRLTGQPQQGAFILQGEITSPDRSKKSAQQTIQIGTDGYLYLSARGGNGGHGGHGGNGQGGGDGSDGMDATRYTWGTDGRPGGDGGSGGNATSGSRAGDGGKITITLNEKDTYLLMLPITDVNGGAGGRAGKNGTGGRGGEGGSGGDSYYETEQVRSGTDSQGNPTYTTKVYSNPGGSDGRDGSNGRNGTANVQDGADGKNGKVTYVVEGKDGNQTYDSRYDIKLLSYEFASADQNGINEPGETVHVKSLRIKNTGGMPSPRFQKVEIYLGNNEWVIADGKIITIPRSLEPGEEFVVEGEFEFKVRDNRIVGREDRFVSEGLIEPLSSLEVAKRPFQNFPLTKKFQITFPVEITPITALRSLKRGETTRLFWSVKNVSDRAFGSLAEIQRLIQMELRQGYSQKATVELNDRLDFSQVQFVGPDGTPASLQSGFLKAIENLAPGESVLIEGKVTISKDAPFYQRAALSLSLSLGDIRNPAEPVIRQIRSFDLRVSQTYRYSQSNVLLVVNSKTTPAEIKAWKDALSRIKLSADIWDLSLYGYLEFTRALEGGSSLAKDFRGKTAIILNNSFDSTTEAGTSEQNAATLMTQRDFLKAAGSAGVNLLFVQNSESVEKEIVGDFLFPKRTHESGSASNHQHESLGDLIRKAVRENELPEEFVDRFEEVEVTTRLLWGQPKASKLEKIAYNAQESLSRSHPDRRYEVIYHHDPKQISKKGLLGLFKKWSLGRIEVRRTLDRSDGSLVAVDMGTQIDPNSNEVLSVILLSLSPEQRTALLSQLSARPSEENLAVLETLTKLMLQEIAVEIEILKSSSSWRDGLTQKELIEKMPNLKALREAKLTGGLSPDTAEGKAWMELFAELKIFAWSQMNWADKLLPLRRSGSLYEVTGDLVEALLEKLFTRPEAQKAARKTIDHVVKTAQSELKSNSYSTKTPLALAGTVRMDYKSGFESGPELVDIRSLYGSPEKRVFEGTQIRAVEKQESDRTRRIRGFEANQNSARTTFLGLCELVFSG